MAARWSDRALDALMVAFAAWTLAYHLCALLRVGVAWAAGIAVVLLAAAAVAFRRLPAPEPADCRLVRAEPEEGDNRWSAWALAAAALGGAAAALLAFTGAPWVLVWLLWLGAAGCAFLAARARRAADPPRVPAWLDAAVALAWALGLAVLSLFLVGPDGDDTYYVHLSTWIAEHGTFPLRDVVHSDEVLPSLYHPPLPSFEALAGAAGHLTGVHVLDLLYIGLPPVGSALLVLALWRLLRAWRVALVPLALTVACCFLLFDASIPQQLGAFSVGRMWQGKVLFLCLLVPLLYVHLQAFAERPSRRGAALLAAAGIAAVGLTTTAIFVVPVLAVGAVLAGGRRALPGAAALAAYPGAAGVLTLAVGGRTPDRYQPGDVVPDFLVHFVLGDGALLAIALGAALVAPALLRRGGAAVAGVALLVGLLYAPGIPELLLDSTGLGRVLWRLTWAVPIVALVGAVATELLPPRFAVAPAAALVALLVVAGQAIWAPAGTSPLQSDITWKRRPAELAAARAIVESSRPGDRVLVRPIIAQSVSIISADVEPVVSRPFFLDAWEGIPAARVRARRTLEQFELATRDGTEAPADPAVRRALDVLGVDLVCLKPGVARGPELLAGAGFVPAAATPEVACMAR